MRTMKIILAFTILIFKLHNGFAQTCHLVKNETDKFTKNRTIHTELVNVLSEKIKVKKTYSIYKIEMQAKFEENRYLINVDYHFDLGNIVINTYGKLVLLLEDGSTIEAPCIQNSPSTKKHTEFKLISSYHFKVSEEDFIKLTKSNITDIRTLAQVNPVDFSISKEVKTSDLFNCILKNK
jgi:hypothetical protein